MQRAATERSKPRTPDTEPSGRSLKFGRALMDPVRVRCDASCKKLSKLSFIGNIGCFVNCPELWRPPATTRPIRTATIPPIIPPAAITTPQTANTITFRLLATEFIPSTTTIPFSPLATGLIPSTTTTLPPSG
ncbi:uncharacterized protein LOC143212864 isoform X2 [Lasioglossum baleicum]|uniref:uncharacterized protein LOC143212864 isoform X2 n=1 Tax=Lasioglossum baleicum TaxID=434251 RepID=UPI003FCCCF9A